MTDTERLPLGLGFPLSPINKRQFSQSGRWKIGPNILDVEYFKGNVHIEGTALVVGYDEDGQFTPDKFAEVTEYGAARYYPTSKPLTE